jgi:hypothetical protein
MTRDDIIRMARQAGLYHFYDSEGHCSGITDARLVDEDQERCDDRLVEMLAPFANLVAAAERERIIAKNAPEIQRLNAHIKALEEAVQAERKNYEHTLTLQQKSYEREIQIEVEAEREACAFDAEWCIQNHLEHLMPERIRARRQV